MPKKNKKKNKENQINKTNAVPSATLASTSTSTFNPPTPIPIFNGSEGLGQQAPPNYHNGNGAGIGHSGSNPTPPSPELLAYFPNQSQNTVPDPDSINYLTHLMGVWKSYGIEFSPQDFENIRTHCVASTTYTFRHHFPFGNPMQHPSGARAAGIQVINVPIPTGQCGYDDGSGNNLVYQLTNNTATETEAVAPDFPVNAEGQGDQLM